MSRIGRAADWYGVVGHPVANSRAPFIHGLFARQTRRDLEYRLYDVPPEDFERRVRDFFATGGCGLNVISPHKAAAARLADELTARASRADGANLLRRRGERILGDNTDGSGLVRDLAHNHGVTLRGSRILLLGAGPASRGVLAPLVQAEPERLLIASRTAERARSLAQSHADLGNIDGCSWDALTAEPFDLAINATAIDFQTDPTAVQIAPALGPRTLAYDLSYAASDTPFTTWARGLHCAGALQGWGMLVEQAADSFEIWHGIRPDTQPALRLLAG